MLVVAMAFVLFATPSHGDTSVGDLINTIKEIVKFWNWGGSDRPQERVIKEDGSGGSGPSRDSAAKATARDSWQSVRGAFQGREGDSPQGARNLEAERMQAIEAARKRGEEDILQNSLGGERQQGGTLLMDDDR